MARLKASEQRASRMHRAPPAVPPNAATDPRLKVGIVKTIEGWALNT